MSPGGGAHAGAGPDALETAARLLAAARKVVVVSGAGISAESGVPTFRDAGGIWSQVRIEDVATPEALRRNPKKVWEFYEGRRSNLQAVQPNPGHRAIAEMESAFAEVVIITQNIDGLHQRAGSTRVLEVHGSLWKARCLDGCGVQRDPFPFPAPAVPPPCECGGVLRPSVVLFGELLPPGAMEEAGRLVSRCDVCLVVGTSGAVWPAAGIPLVARQAGRPTIEVNPTDTEISSELDVLVRGPSGQVLPALLRRALELRA
jgi:NAD-dependent deacetylase